MLGLLCQLPLCYKDECKVCVNYSKELLNYIFGLRNIYRFLLLLPTDGLHKVGRWALLNVTFASVTLYAWYAYDIEQVGLKHKTCIYTFYNLQ